MNNGELNLVTLSQPNRIPLGALYLGNISNACTTTITGTLQVNGDLSGTSLSAPISVGPASFSVTGYSVLTGTATYSLTLPAGANPGAYQAQVQVGRLSEPVGRIVVSLIILDLATPNTDDMDPPASLGGLMQLLQLASQEHFEHI